MVLVLSSASDAYSVVVLPEPGAVTGKYRGAYYGLQALQVSPYQDSADADGYPAYRANAAPPVHRS